jgi:hypothetical protein
MSVVSKAKVVINTVLAVVTMTRVLGMLLNKKTRDAALSNSGRGPNAG